MNDLRFQQLESLHWLWLVLVVAIVILIGLRLRRAAIRRFASVDLLSHLIASASPGRQVAKAILVIVAMVALVAGLLDPRWGVTFRQVQQRGVDLLIVLDVSRSMLAEDAVPNRLERARHFIGDLVDQAQGDRVGLITFAGVPEVRCPLTVDTSAFKLSLDTVRTESGGRGGSLLGDAIRLAAASFTDAVPDHKAIVVFTDGEDHGSYPREAIDAMRSEIEIPVYTIGLGDSAEGGRIPIEEGGVRRYLTHEGQEVWSVQNADLLRDIALASGGAYVPVGTGHVEMSDVYAERIEPMAKREFETTQQRLFHVRYQWFAVIALILLVLEGFIGERRSPRTIARGAALALLSVASVIALGAQAPTTPPSDGRLIDDARVAMDEGRYVDALALYDTMRERRPDLAEVPYNMGVAAYRLEDFDQAARMFDEAARLTTDPSLRARSAYNMGTSTYQAARLGETPADEADVQEQMNAATGQLESAIDQLRRAVAADPSDRDARANAEHAQRRLNQLRELMEQQPQQQQQGEGDDGDESDEQQSDQQQQQQPGQEESQDQQSGDQNQDQNEQQQQQGQQGEEPQDDEEQSSSPSDDEPDDASSEEEQQQQQSSGEESSEDAASSGAMAERDQMSREEAERLLQAVRDKARRRAEEQAEARATDRARVIRDW